MGKPKKNVQYTSPYTLEGRIPMSQALPLGMQHVLAMFVGNLTPILVLSSLCGIESGGPLQIALLQNAMLVAGIVTFFQLYPLGFIGSGLPIVMLTAAGFLGVFGSVVATMGGSIEAYGALLGASLIGGIVEAVLGFFLKPMQRFFPPVVIGTVVLSIGLSLLNVGINSFGGGQGAADFGSVENVCLALVVLIVILAFKHFTKGVTSYSAILFGIVVGYILAGIMSVVLPTTISVTDPATGVVTEVTKSWVLNWDKVAQASWFSLPKLMPVKIVFDMRAILPITIMFVVTTVITMGNVAAVANGGLGRNPTAKETLGGITCDGVGSAFAVLFGVLPNTSASQNAGLVAMTKAVNKFGIATGAIFLIICGFLPKLVALISIMPQSVLGGASAMLFASISVSGMQIISKSRFTPRAFTIVAVAIGVGYGVGANSAVLAGLPPVVSLIFGGSGVVPAAIVATILNIVLPKEKEDLAADEAERQANEAANAAAQKK
nr:solute carrier family 23 protein [uncultured Flavonifractor sp.]